MWCTPRSHCTFNDADQGLRSECDPNAIRCVSAGLEGTHPTRWSVLGPWPSVSPARSPIAWIHPLGSNAELEAQFLVFGFWFLILTRLPCVRPYFLSFPSLLFCFSELRLQVASGLGLAGDPLPGVRAVPCRPDLERVLWHRQPAAVVADPHDAERGCERLERTSRFIGLSGFLYYSVGSRAECVRLEWAEAKWGSIAGQS